MSDHVGIGLFSKQADCSSGALWVVEVMEEAAAAAAVVGAAVAAEVVGSDQHTSIHSATSLRIDFRRAACHWQSVSRRTMYTYMCCGFYATVLLLYEQIQPA